MSLKDQIANDLDNVLFDLDDFAEEVVYEGVTLKAHIQRLKDRSVESGNARSFAKVWLIKSSIPVDQKADYMEEIVFDGQTWRVEEVDINDNYVVELFCRHREGYSFEM